MRDDLQELVDRVSRLLGAPATLEDAEFTLLAFCAHPLDGGEAVLDAVRTRSILTRGSSPEVRRWFEEFGIARAQRPLRIPGDVEAGILPRLMLPVRHAGRTSGYLWLLDGGRTDAGNLTDPALAEAVRLAGEAGRILAERSGEDADLDRALATALAGPDGREQALAVLAGQTGATPHVLVALQPAGALPSDWQPPVAAAVARPAATRTDAAVPDAVAVLVPLPVAGDLRPAAALTAGALSGLPPGSTAGMSEVAPGAARLLARWTQARTAARVAAVVPALSPVAHWGELGGWRLVGELSGPDPAVLPLLADPVLTRTAETWLDAGGSAARTAAALSIHRQTLYYRLGRIEALTGLDLADGDARLLVHASLRRARLDRGAGGRSGPVT